MTLAFHQTRLRVPDIYVSRTVGEDFSVIFETFGAFEQGGDSAVGVSGGAKEAAHVLGELLFV